MAIWKSTRGDKKKLLDDIKANPGKTYYAVSEAAQPWGNEPVYREIDFKKSRSWGGTWGHMSAEATLAHFGEITDAKPRGLKNLFGKPDELHHPDASKAVPKPRRLFARR